MKASVAYWEIRHMLHNSTAALFLSPSSSTCFVFSFFCFAPLSPSSCRLFHLSISPSLSLSLSSPHFSFIVSLFHYALRNEGAHLPLLFSLWRVSHCSHITIFSHTNVHTHMAIYLKYLYCKALIRESCYLMGTFPPCVCEWESWAVTGEKWLNIITNYTHTHNSVMPVLPSALEDFFFFWVECSFCWQFVRQAVSPTRCKTTITRTELRSHSQGSLTARAVRK